MGNYIYWSVNESQPKKIEDMSIEELEILNEKMRKEISDSKDNIKKKLSDMSLIIKELSLKKAQAPIPFVQK